MNSLWREWLFDVNWCSIDVVAGEMYGALSSWKWKRQPDCLSRNAIDRNWLFQRRRTKWHNPIGFIRFPQWKFSHSTLRHTHALVRIQFNRMEMKSTPEDSTGKATQNILFVILVFVLVVDSATAWPCIFPVFILVTSLHFISFVLLVHFFFYDISDMFCDWLSLWRRHLGRAKIDRARFNKDWFDWAQNETDPFDILVEHIPLHDPHSIIFKWRSALFIFISHSICMVYAIISCKFLCFCYRWERLSEPKPLIYAIERHTEIMRNNKSLVNVEQFRCDISTK